MIVYINIDGFSMHYYEQAKKKNLVPTLEKIKEEGVVFTNLRTLPPSITNPCQAMIISGATSSKIHNVYRYYDKKKNIVVQQKRENDADTIYDSLIRNHIDACSIHHFPAERVFSKDNEHARYIKTPVGIFSNYSARFDQAIHLIKNEKIQNGDEWLNTYKKPKFLSIYCDDLDSIGHNEVPYDTFCVARNEEERIQNAITRLSQIDKKLDEFIQICKKQEVYDEMTFFLTTDHGMQEFGAESFQNLETSPYSKTKWIDLKKKLESLHPTFHFEYVAPNQKPNDATTIVGVGCGLQMPLTFKNMNLSEDGLQTIKSKLKEEYYISEVYTRKELLDHGFWEGANVDLLVIPSGRYHFHGRDDASKAIAVRGQHDTLSSHATRIYGAIWGAKIKRIGEWGQECYNASFGSTMAKLLQIDLKDANLPALEEIIEK